MKTWEWFVTDSTTWLEIIIKLVSNGNYQSGYILWLALIYLDHLATLNSMFLTLKAYYFVTLYIFHPLPILQSTSNNLWH